MPQSVQAPAQAEAAASQGEQLEEPPLDPASLIERDRQRSEAAQTRMEVELENQPRDRAFERTVEGQLQAVYGLTESAGSRLVSLECRTTLCRVTTQHDNRDTMISFARKAANHPPFQNEVFYRYGEGDAPQSSLYFSRPGSPLPHDF